jgi:flagellar motor switch protein FliM
MNPASAQTYDLSTPAPLPREAARRLATQRESLAEELRIHVRRLLRLRTEVTVGDADVARVRHFSSFHAGKAWWYSGAGTGERADRAVLLGCAPDLVYAAIDRTLGGPGHAKSTGKPPTAIETELGMRFLRDVFAGFTRALAMPPVQLTLSPSRPLTEPLLTFMPDLEEPFARIPWKVKLFDQEHELLFCVSRRLLQAAEPKPEEHHASSEAMSPPLASAPIELMVELARCRLSIDEASALAPGDVVLFELPPGEPIDVRIQGKPRFRAKLGTHEKRYAIEVTQLLEEAPAPPPAVPVPAKASSAAAGAKAGGAAAQSGPNAAARANAARPMLGANVNPNANPNPKTKGT